MPTEIKQKPKIEPETTDQMSDEKQNRYWFAVGRRKEAIAKIKLFTKGPGISVNGKDYKEYFKFPALQSIAEAALNKMKSFERFRIESQVRGGGLKGQAEALRLGISRALVSFNKDYRKRLRRADFLTRDPRVKERRKYGLKKARRAPQFAKR